MQQEIYGLLDKLVEFGNVKFSLLLREYLQFAVNVLSSSPKSSDVIKNNIF